ncbi:hypothetical protein CCP2SC5_40050 [Azospirillaceae bacterium]
MVSHKGREIAPGHGVSKNIKSLENNGDESFLDMFVMNLRDMKLHEKKLPRHDIFRLPRTPISATNTLADAMLGRGQEVRQRTLIPRSQVRILAPQPNSSMLFRVRRNILRGETSFPSGESVGV